MALISYCHKALQILYDGNEGFTGSIQQETIEDFYNKDGELRQFKCVTNDAWWWGKLTV